ncbi:MAG: LUD domain-containing protein [Bifidobacteriaceae bacterium]|jgi:L-lactate dehydrogenase complex protein LldG|nr:LUD domain-containing protein [Bifidobacteriaceae bacterium]
MTTARESIMSRIRTALADVPPPPAEDPPATSHTRAHHTASEVDLTVNDAVNGPTAVNAPVGPDAGGDQTASADNLAVNDALTTSGSVKTPVETHYGGGQTASAGLVGDGAVNGPTAVNAPVGPDAGGDHTTSADNLTVNDAVTTSGSVKPPVEADDGSGQTASAGLVSGDAVVGLFAERLADYGAVVVRVPAAGAAAAAARLVAEHGGSAVAVPPGMSDDVLAALQAAGVTTAGDNPPLSAADLDALDGTVTACRIGVAQTGTLVLDHAADQGRRALTLVPDRHLCLVRADQIVPDVPAAVARLRPSVLAGRPLTWVSGPSATVDIELTRVQGVHGPRTLLVVIAEDRGGATAHGRPPSRPARAGEVE